MYRSHRFVSVFQILAFFIAVFAVFIWGCSHRNKSDTLIGRDPSWYPENLGTKTDEINGFTNALIGNIGNNKIQIIDIDSINLLQGLDDQEYPAILSSLPPTEENQDRYLFSNPYLLIGPVLVVPFNSKATSLDDFEEKIVGVSPYDDSILIAQKNPTLIIKEYEAMPTALEDLATGEIDAVLLNTLKANALIPNLYPETLRIVSYPLNKKGLRLIALRGENEDLISHFNTKLSELRESGEYTKLRKQFGIP